MKKLLYLTLLLSAGFLTHCKKNSELVAPVPGTGPEIEVPPLGKAGDFLKMLTVTGAEKIVFDSVRNSYYVSLPDSYDESKAEVKLSLKKNIVLWDSAATSITKDSVIRYNYKGTSPLSFKLSDNPEKSWFYLTVFFNFSGTPKIELLSNDIPMDSRGSNLPLRFLAKVGSIPASFDQYGPVVKVINRKTGFTADSYLYPENKYVNFNEAEKLFTSDPIALEISLFNQKTVVFEGVRFTRGLPVLTVAPDYKFIYAQKDTIKAFGGYFTSNAKYSVTFTSDYIPAPVVANVKFLNTYALTVDQIPSSLPEGSYLVSFYEDERLLGKSAIHVSATEKSSIESIWKGGLNLAPYRNITPLSFNKGDSFFAKSIPLTYFSGPVASPDASKLPTIRLNNGQKTVDLKPELVVYNWAIAGVSYAVGKYMIPTDLATGAYEVTALSADGKQTRPYWSKIQVR